MLKDALFGVSHVLNGFRLIKKPGVKRYVVVPALINLILFSSAFWFGYTKLDAYIEQILPTWLAWLEFIIWPLVILASLVVMFFAFTLVANLLGAPFNSVLSEKIEHHLSPTENRISSGNSNYLDLLKAASMGLGSELRKLFYIISRAIPLLILSIIPGLNLIAPFLWFLFGAWMLAIEYLDYPMGNHDIKFKDQLILIKQNRFKCIGMGAALMFMTITPILNFFAMPVGVAAATSLWSKNLKSTSSTNLLHSE